jgi:spermidine synthase
MFDFLKPKVLETANSKFSGTLKVLSGFGYKYITTGFLTQTGGIVRDVWEPVLKKYGRPRKSWLILGLAGGTIAKVVSDRFAPTKIVGVEIDPVMIELGKKYLDLEKIPHLKIEITDAQKYVALLDQKFDFILVDMYYGDQLPAFVYTPQFLKKLRLLGSCVIFNHLFYDAPKKSLTHSLIEELKTLFTHIKLFHQLSNLLIVCEA